MPLHVSLQMNKYKDYAIPPLSSEEYYIVISVRVSHQSSRQLKSMNFFRFNVSIHINIADRVYQYISWQYVVKIYRRLRFSGLCSVNLHFWKTKDNFEIRPIRTSTEERKV